MDRFCGSKYWNQTLTWDALSEPDLTWCFEEVALFGAPALLLFATTIVSVVRFKTKEYFLNAYKYRRIKEPHAKQTPTPWNFLNVCKLSVYLLLALLASLELISYIWYINLDNDQHMSLLDWVAPISKALTCLYLANLLILHRRHSVYSSAPVFFFNFFFLIYHIVTFRTIFTATYENGRYYLEFSNILFACRTVSLYLAAVQFLLHCISEQTPESSSVNPHATASMLSRLTFWWFTRLILTGYRRPITERDVWRLDRPNQCRTILKRLDRKLDGLKTEKIIHRMSQQERARNSAKGYDHVDEKDVIKIPQRKPIVINVAKLIVSIYWKQLIVVVWIKLVGSVLTFSNPFFLDRLLTFMRNADEPMWRGVLYASMMWIVPAIESLLNNQYEYWINVVVLRVRTCLNSLIYTKSLRLSTYGKRNFSTGEIITIMTVDAQRVADFLNFANTLWAAPIQFGLAMYFLWQQVGISALGGIIFLVILIPLNGLISTRIKAIQVRLMRAKDARTKWMNEVLNAMRMIKLYAWELPFIQKVKLLRDRECKELYKSAYYGSFMFFAFSAAPLVVGIITFSLYVLTGGVLDPNRAFVSLSLFNVIRVPMGMLPMLFSMGVTCLVAIKRINRYLNSEEIDDTAITSLPDHEHAIVVRDATFTWNESSAPLLRHVNLEVGHGKLIAVVGQMGSGKSSLLSGLLGDMQKLSGKVNMDGKIAYMSQQAWIQNATVRKNILFTRSYDERRYNKIIQSCCLEPDLRILPGGDLTEIGERGTTLSGGQKQRVALARAVYSGANIFLLDDPLSAVDAHVGRKLFENVIGNNGLLRNKTRVLVTHRVSCLPEVDEIIVMKNGEISERGTINELVEKQGAFAEFIAEYLDEKWMAEEQENDQASSSVEDKNKVPASMKEDAEMMRSLVQAVKPILERTRSRADSNRTGGSGSDRLLESVLAKSQQSLTDSLASKQQAMAMTAEDGKAREKRDTQKESRGKLIGVESSQTGSVKLSVYMQYFKTVGLVISLIIFGGLVTANTFTIFGALWLSEWSNDAIDPVRALDENLRNKRLLGYAGYGAGEILCNLASNLALNIACIKASKALHNGMLQNVLFAPMYFFDTTPVGRILNRFSRDIDVADYSLVFNLRMTFTQFFRTVVAFTLLSMEASTILLALLPILIFYYIIQRLYISTSRQLKRIESTTRSPIFNHFTETVYGCTTIRAYSVNDRFIEEYNSRIDVNNSCFYSSFTASRWLSIRLEFFGYTIVFLAAIFAVFSRGWLSAGLAGLAISYSLNISAVVSMFIRCTTDLETNIVSIERVLEYSQLTPEASYRGRALIPIEWPAQGEVSFDDYSTRYREGMDLVLHNVSFTIKPGEKIGIVGRTGAGKSSMCLALFRLIEPAGGRIVVDPVDISTLGLFDLRSQITIIPQDAHLFTGTLRLNLDPFERYSDEQLWQALEVAHLKDYVLQQSHGLSHEVEEGGANLSVGQRQLVCLARAVLRKKKILVMDEATSAIDIETDELVQKTIRKEFADCTIMTIAHRLNTVIDYDRILVLSEGQVAEYDCPDVLLADENSMFHSMAKAAGLI